MIRVPLRASRVPALVAAALVLPGCASLSRSGCHEPQDYQQAKTAAPLKIPEGLNAPATRGSLKIPELPATARTRGADEPCLEEPPSFYPGRPKPGQGLTERNKAKEEQAKQDAATQATDPRPPSASGDASPAAPPPPKP